MYQSFVQFIFLALMFGNFICSLYNVLFTIQRFGQGQVNLVGLRYKRRYRFTVSNQCHSQMLCARSAFTFVCGDANLFTYEHCKNTPPMTVVSPLDPLRRAGIKTTKTTKLISNNLLT